MTQIVIAGICINVDEPLAELLPERIHPFVATQDVQQKPPLYVQTTSRLFCVTEGIGERCFRYKWHGECFYAKFIPARRTLLIPQDYLSLANTRNKPGVQFCITQALRTVMGLTLLEQGGFILHASAICSGGRGLLFSGLSGAGKSTQARLWQQYAGAEILNHDSPMITFSGNQYHCHGNPWSGSDACYKQLSVPVRCLIALEQGKGNAIEPLSPKQALKFLLTQSLSPAEKGEDIDKIIRNMTAFAHAVPLLRFSCLPDESAVDVLNRYLIAQEVMLPC